MGFVLYILTGLVVLWLLVRFIPLDELSEALCDTEPPDSIVRASVVLLWPVAIFLGVFAILGKCLRGLTLHAKGKRR